MGVEAVVGVYDPKEEIDLALLPAPASRCARATSSTPSSARCRRSRASRAIIYIQTCAAEKRRRRKRGTVPRPRPPRLHQPRRLRGLRRLRRAVELRLDPAARDRVRPQARDRPVLAATRTSPASNGFCPSFVTLEGAKVRKAAPRRRSRSPTCPAPTLPAIDGTYNIVITGVGGTGVVTVGALIAMAAHLEGKGAGEMEMAGLAQKGGAVHIHCRIAETPGGHLRDPRRRRRGRRADRRRPRRLGRRQDPRPDGPRPHPRRGQRPRDHHRRLHPRPRLPPPDRPADAGAARPARRGRACAMLDATRLAEKLLGDAIYANVLMLGAAWQAGLVPLGEEALLRAIEINGADVEGNTPGLPPSAAGRSPIPPRPPPPRRPPAPPPAEDLDTLVDRRAAHLADYQGRRLARRYRERIAAAAEGRSRTSPTAMARATTSSCLQGRVRGRPPARRDAAGRGRRPVHRRPRHALPPRAADPRRHRRLGPPEEARVRPVDAARLRRAAAASSCCAARRFDPFGYTAERRMERALIAEYERDMDARPGRA